MVETKVTTKDARFKDIVEGKTPTELILMGGKLPSHTLRPSKTNPNRQEFVVVPSPTLTRDEYWAKELKVRQRDAAAMGMPQPIGITSWGESIMPQAERKPFAPKSRIESQNNPATQPRQEEPPKAPRTVGVVQSIIDALKSASKKKPITRDAILKILVKKFPDREASAMKKTISSQVPGALKTEKGIVVSTDGKGGYWISK